MLEWISNINHEVILFLCFNLIIIFLLSLDLGLLSKKEDHTMSLKRAGLWTLLWVTVSFLFAVFIYYYDTDPNNPEKNQVKTMEYIAGYLLEYSLSVDNLFVFIMIFQKFKIGPRQQPDILKWGIIGAVVLRAIMIGGGAALISKFTWILYIFGVFLLYTAVKMYTHKDDEEEAFDPNNSKIISLLNKFIEVKHETDSGKFFLIENGKRYATTLFVVLVLIEASDVMFALDSIPAVFSITQDAFIVYTSNIFAILGLRSLYFMISGIMDLFKYLKQGVALILAFVGIKMLLPVYGEIMHTEKIHVPIPFSLGVIIFVLLISILLSLPEYLKKRKEGSA